MKDKKILVGIHGRPSMMMAYGSMRSGTLWIRRIINGKKFYRFFTNNVLKRIKKKTATLEDSIVVRWGSREELPTNSGTIVYNTSGAIANATDKKLSRTLFNTHKVMAPKFVTTENFQEKDLPVIARPSRHAKGKNFIILRTEEDFREHYIGNFHHGWYYSAFINKQNEYRIHMAHGKALAIMKKPRPEDKNSIAWNRALNEDPFVYVKWDEANEKISIKNSILQASKAVESLGLDFGGVDVITLGQNAFVLEVNTSPTLSSSEYVAERWGKYFDVLFSSEKRIPHWDISFFQKGSSMIWKNKQLNTANVSETINSIQETKK